MKTRYNGIATALCGVVLAICATVSAHYYGFTLNPAQLTGLVLATNVVAETNVERSQAGVNTLARSAVLDKAAALKARDMLVNQYFAHTSPGGVTPWYWFRQAGYSYRRAGENLAVHFDDSEKLVHAWMESPTHRANIVNGTFTEIGIGIATGTFEGVPTTVVVQLFGTPHAGVTKKAGAPGLGAAVGDALEYEVIQDTADVGPNETAYTERIPLDEIPVSEKPSMVRTLVQIAFSAACVYLLMTRKPRMLARYPIIHSVMVTAMLMSMVILLLTAL